MTRRLESVCEEDECESYWVTKTLYPHHNLSRCGFNFKPLLLMIPLLAQERLSIQLHIALTNGQNLGYFRLHGGIRPAVGIASSCRGTANGNRLLPIIVGPNNAYNVQLSN